MRRLTPFGRSLAYPVLVLHIVGAMADGALAAAAGEADPRRTPTVRLDIDASYEVAGLERPLEIIVDTWG